MLRLWTNPEFMRHFRSELRRTRATAVALVVVAVCALTVLACWAEQESHLMVMQRASGNAPSAAMLRLLITGTALSSFRALMFMQFGVLGFWSVFACAQAVSRERERGTWDFQRITRLTPSELLAGKLFGEPVLAYFIVACGFPISLVAGIIGGVSILHILSAFLILLSFAVFVGVAGLWLSSVLEGKGRGIVVIAALGMFGILVGAQGLSTSPFPGLAAFSPVSTSWPMLQYPSLSPNPVIFGAPVPWIVMALLLYSSFGAWIVLMLLRNLKRDFQELRLLSRWEVVGCCAFLNFVLYSLFSPNVEVFRDTADLAEFMLAANGFFFFFLGLTMLDSPERLDTTPSFSVRSLFSEHGLQWPWLLASSVTSYLLLIWGLLAWGRALPSSAGLPATAAIHLLIMTLFITRDVLFIQWCKLTGLRSPLMKGVLFLCLYYASVGVLCAVTEVSSDRFAIGLGNVLTPAAAFNRAGSWLSVTGALGIVLQLMAIAFLVSAIHGRVGKIRLAAAPVTA